MGLAVENPDDRLYRMLKKLHDSLSGTLQLRTPFRVDTEIAGKRGVDYTARRAVIESVKNGSHQYVTEGHLSTVPVAIDAAGNQQLRWTNTPKFDGWRKEV